MFRIFYSHADIRDLFRSLTDQRFRRMRPKLILLSAEVIQFGHMCGFFCALNLQIPITKLFLGHILSFMRKMYKEH